MQRVDVLTVGTVARQRLGETQQASLLGLTRRGWLLRLDAGWVIFLSQEALRGPLTLNLAAGAALPLAEPGLRAQVRGDALLFPAAALRVDFGRAAVWSAPPVPQGLLPAAERYARLAEVARLCLAGTPSPTLPHPRAGWGRGQPPSPGLQHPQKALSGDGGMGQEVLPVVLGWQGEACDPALLAMVEQLISSLRGDGKNITTEVVTTRLAEALAPLLGLGRGLTPSGDDLALGLLLALRRWGARLGWQGDIDAVCAAVAGLAAQRTTTLSANLIACAGMGQADERLLTALDGIVTGQPGPADCAAALAGWGSSSGVDALVGMALILHKAK